ncbi:hypothetical protein BT69DRAFT_1302321 [Atractiella rhizophila]|nr:hypothetical protein BT69DRAFT_1302321 [Atractiella rhizophila]
MSPKAAARKRGRPAKRTAVLSSPAVNTVQAIEFTPVDLYPENGAHSTSIKKWSITEMSQRKPLDDENIAEYYGALVKSKLEYLDKRYEQLKSNMSSTGAGLTEEEVQENPEAWNTLDKLKGQHHNIAVPSKGHSATPIDITHLQQKDPRGEGEVGEFVDEIPSFIAVAMEDVLSGNREEEQDLEQMMDEFVLRQANVSDQLEPGHLDNANRGTDVCAEEHPFSLEINANHMGINLTGDVPGPVAVLSDEKSHWQHTFKLNVNAPTMTDKIPNVMLTNPANSSKSTAKSIGRKGKHPISLDDSDEGESKAKPAQQGPQHNMLGNLSTALTDMSTATEARRAQQERLDFKQRKLEQEAEDKKEDRQLRREEMQLHTQMFQLQALGMAGFGGGSSFGLEGGGGFGMFEGGFDSGQFGMAGGSIFRGSPGGGAEIFGMGLGGVGGASMFARG